MTLPHHELKALALELAAAMPPVEDTIPKGYILVSDEDCNAVCNKIATLEAITDVVMCDPEGHVAYETIPQLRGGLYEGIREVKTMMRAIVAKGRSAS